MSGKRKSPKLRSKEGCFVSNIYKPNGKRTTISFGPVGPRTEGDIYAAFGQWLDLFNQHPHKVLAYKDPYEAIDNVFSSAKIIMVGQLIDKYIEWFVQHRPSPREGGTHPDVERVLRLRRFTEPYLDWPVSDFGPDELLAVRQAMVDYRYSRCKDGSDVRRYTRSGINDVLKHVGRIWAWGIGRSITTEAQRQLLKEVQSLRLGQTEAPDNDKRTAVTEEDFQKVVAASPRVVGDLMRVIWETAMRPGEAVIMRPCDINCRHQECWIYLPQKHKTQYIQRTRAIPLTAKVQGALMPRIKDFASKEYIFSAVEAMEEIRAARSASRKTPLSCGNRPGTNRSEHPMIKPGERYKVQSLCNAVKRACRRAGVKKFTPYDLRRTAATRIRRLLDKDAAKLLLGHVDTETTDIYLLEEVQEAMKAAGKLESLS